MSLTKQTSIDKIEIVAGGIVQVRQVTKIIEDGQEISQSFHRSTIIPGQNYDDQPDNVKAICELTHTPEVIDAYQARLEEFAQRLGQ